MRKKILSLLLSLTCITGLTSCGSSPTTSNVQPTEDNSGVQGDETYIAVICKGSEHEFWKASEAGAIDAGNELGIKITFTAPENESQIDKQIELIEEAISNGADALLVAPLDVDALNNTLRSADEKGIPVITFDSDVSYSGRKATIGTENASAGSIAARKAVELLEGNANATEVGIVGHVKGAQTAIERVDGFMEEMKKHESISIKSVEYSDGNVEKAKDITIEMINSNPDIDLIYATNEGAAVGVCEAVEQLGKVNDISPCSVL